MSTVRHILLIDRGSMQVKLFFKKEKAEKKKMSLVFNQGPYLSTVLVRLNKYSAFNRFTDR
ncbi:hypothetical protein I7I50_02115 [Histoplasma capsulatum G186AR]|uniref:Uncharacterized protein n=1 Tax=Ajellomyces capsulatus TaxID=5037 RepID=A0A8H7YAE2_AJECA|nr:hypothetical protein I7I52_12329 [Histoplasma capsulatum]QSS71323.1 hypothetical protein I7I50_02115 [Histoplasma capsulatum G186AR]